MRAASNGHLSCLQTLISAKAEINSPVDRIHTSLSQAAVRGQLAYLQTLIAAKANINHPHYKHGYTAIKQAQLWDQLLICEALAEAMLYIPNDEQKKKIVI